MKRLRKYLEPQSRSREGAWIEMPYLLCTFTTACSRSREGAWIEMEIKE